MKQTKYPVYVLSKGRADCCKTAKCFTEDRLKFYLVVEPQEYEQYRKNFPNAEILVLPEGHYGKGAITTRNWIWSHSIENGYDRHWEFDDNIRIVGRLNKGKRIRCNAYYALSAIEEFNDRYENLHICGMNYQMFVLNTTTKPFYYNCHAYSGLLIQNNIPYRWRLRYNADTDLCLQVLHDGNCIINFNAFFIDKTTTMKMKGGNTDRYKGDGRWKMARVLEEVWPQYVTVTWKFGRPQHQVNWKKHFGNNQLIRRKDIDWNKIAKKGNNDYGMTLKAKGKIKSKSLQKFYDNEQDNRTNRTQ